MDLHLGAPPLFLITPVRHGIGYARCSCLLVHVHIFGTLFSVTESEAHEIDKSFVHREINSPLLECNAGAAS